MQRFCALLAATLFGASGLAQPYPEKPVRIVNTFSGCNTEY